MLTDLSLPYLLEVPTRRRDDELMPLVVLLHGRGADAHDLAEVARYLDSTPGFRFVFPNAPMPFEAAPGLTFGWTWFDGWPPVHDSLVASRERLLRFLGEVGARYATPAGRFVLGGFSQGALMSLDSGLRLEPQPAGIVAMSGGLYERDLGDLESRAGIPVFLAHGLDDEVVSVNYARRARRLLESAGLAVEYHEIAMGHQVAQEEITAVQAFLARVLGA